MASRKRSRRKGKASARPPKKRDLGENHNLDDSSNDGSPVDSSGSDADAQIAKVPKIEVKNEIGSESDDSSNFNLMALSQETFTRSKPLPVKSARGKDHNEDSKSAISTGSDNSNESKSDNDRDSDSDSDSASDGSDFDLNALSQEVRPATDFEGSEVEDSDSDNSDSDSASTVESTNAASDSSYSDNSESEEEEEENAAPNPPGAAGTNRRNTNKANSTGDDDDDDDDDANDNKTNLKKEKKTGKEKKKVKKETNGAKKPKRFKDAITRLRSIGRASIVHVQTRKGRKSRFRVYIKNQFDKTNQKREINLRTFEEARDVAIGYTQHKYWGVRQVKGYKWFQAFIIRNSKIVGLNFHSTAKQAACEHDEVLVNNHPRLDFDSLRLNFPEKYRAAMKKGASGADLFEKAFSLCTKPAPLSLPAREATARGPYTREQTQQRAFVKHLVPGGTYTRRWRDKTFARYRGRWTNSKTTTQEHLELFNLERLIEQLLAQDRFTEAARVAHDLNRHVITMGQLPISRPFRCMVMVTTLALARGGKMSMAESFVRKLLPLVQSFHVSLVRHYRVLLGENVSLTKLPLDVDTRQHQIWTNWNEERHHSPHLILQRQKVWADARAWLITLLGRFRAALGRADEALLYFDQHLQLVTFRERIEPRLCAAAICVLRTEDQDASLSQLEALKRAQTYLHQVEAQGPLASDLIECIVETQLQIVLLVGVSSTQRLTQQSQDVAWMDSSKSHKNARRNRSDAFVTVYQYAATFPNRVAGPWGLARLYDLQLQMTDEEDEIFHAKSKADLRGALRDTLRRDPLHLLAAQKLLDLLDPPLPGEIFDHNDPEGAPARFADEDVGLASSPKKRGADDSDSGSDVESVKKSASAGAGHSQTATQTSANEWVPADADVEAQRTTDTICDSIECLPFESCPTLSVLFRFAFGPHFVYEGQKEALKLWKLLDTCPPACLAKAGKTRRWWRDRFFTDWQEIRFEMTWCKAVPEQNSIHLVLLRRILATGVKMGFVERSEDTLEDPAFETFDESEENDDGRGDVQNDSDDL
ncbi:Hypothetical Protein FCC1311_086652 [Hondaea fermentalgiana]|uniref:Uncharacterized protein n=1 Tax=Hondaea fermentalgiana TaxID=2315210 RepID=A0A2R5GNH6_9STRA|nr:Hypothetical Protein FCC1311_086652 [Hondaea fermentalgiana]|eukprot:GBG32440.1 Hypothetical Protein FCC1311_086652 [Hondaea fermentalgiana]